MEEHQRMNQFTTHSLMQLTTLRYGALAEQKGQQMIIKRSDIIIEVGADFFDWKITSKINTAQLQDYAICVDHTKQNEWPTQKNAYGDGEYAALWLFVWINGKWHGAANRLRPFPQNRCKPVGAGINKIAIDFVGRSDEPLPDFPMTYWKPENGLKFGLMMSTPARDANMPMPHERSAITFYEWKMGVLNQIDIEVVDVPNPNPDPTPIEGELNDLFNAYLETMMKYNHKLIEMTKKSSTS